MRSTNNKIIKLIFLSVSFIFLTAVSSLEYTRKAEPLPNMPEGNPDPSLGIVVRGNSTGVDVAADSSQNVKFTAFKNSDGTAIEILRSSSMVNHNPKKFKFIDGKHSFSSDNIYELSILFSYKNNIWKHIRFMPFCSVSEWVTKEKLITYLDKWAKTFEDAGWETIEYTSSDTPQRIQNYMLPTSRFNQYIRYCSWRTNDYKAVISVALRNPKNYKDYLTKEQLQNVSTIPNGYITFIDIYRNS